MSKEQPYILIADSDLERGGALANSLRRAGYDSVVAVRNAKLARRFVDETIELEQPIRLSLVLSGDLAFGDARDDYNPPRHVGTHAVTGALREWTMEGAIEGPIAVFGSSEYLMTKETVGLTRNGDEVRFNFQDVGTIDAAEQIAALLSTVRS